MTAIATEPTTQPPVHHPRGRIAERAGLRIGERFASPGRIGALIALVVLAVLWLLPFLWAIVTSFKSETDASSTPVSIFTEERLHLQTRTERAEPGEHPALDLERASSPRTAITVITLVVSALAAYALLAAATSRPALAVLGDDRVDHHPAAGAHRPAVLRDAHASTSSTRTGPSSCRRSSDRDGVHPQAVLRPGADRARGRARIDGAGRLRVFWSIVLPLSRPILAAVSIFVFIGAWNNFLWPFIADQRLDR